MSATLFDADLLPAQSPQEAPGGAAASVTSIKAPGLFTRIMDAIGSAYTVKMPDGEVVVIYPPC